MPVPGSELGHAQGQPVVRAWRPLLQVRHLHPDRGVDPVGGLDQAREQHREERRVAVLGVDRGADRVDPGPVLGSEVARRRAERLGEVAGNAVERVEPFQRDGERVEVHRVTVGLDVAAREHLGVPGGVDRRHDAASALELLRDPGRAREEIERVAGPGRGEHLTEHRHQTPLRPQVLDHDRFTVRGGASYAAPMADAELDSWWREGVLYQIYPRSYQDSTGDGVGDVPGIISRLDHLQWLGIRGIWLSPVTVSPNADFGYDVADFCDVDPTLGTLADVETLVDEAAAARHQVLLDLVPNHTSDRAPVVPGVAVVAGQPASATGTSGPIPKPDGSPPNNWVSSFGGSAWTLDEHDRPVLPAELPARAGRPQLVERGGARRVRPHPALLVRPGRGRVPHRRRPHGHQGPRAARQPARDRRPTRS